MPDVPALLTSKPRTGALCCEVSEWLASWNPNPDDSLPPEIVAALPALRTEARSVMAPASAREFLVALDLLWKFARTFGIKATPEEVEEATQAYRASLADLPLDLLAEAIQRTKAAWTYRNLPLPAEIRAHISDQLTRRRLIANRLRLAEMYARWATT